MGIPKDMHIKIHTHGLRKSREVRNQSKVKVNKIYKIGSFKRTREA